jgi:hypothetical protein
MCWSLAWLANLIVWLIIAATIIAVLRLLIPWLLGLLGIGGPIPQIVNIILVAAIAIVAVMVVFALLACLTGGGYALPPVLR